MKQKLHLAPILTFGMILAILLSAPISNQFQFDDDEGINLGKAMLVAQGRELYSEIWSDQPPLLTFILAGAIKIFGRSVLAARLITVAFSGLLIWAAFRTMEDFANLRTAVIGSLLLLVTDPFLRLSYAVMVGLPAIALAVLATYAIMQWHKTRIYGWLGVSAVGLALSVSTKLFTALLVPIFFLGLLHSDWRASKPKVNVLRRFGPTLAWAVLFATVLGAIFWALVGVENIQQLVTPHLEARQVEGFPSAGFLIPSLFALISAIGAIFILRDRK